MNIDTDWKEDELTAGDVPLSTGKLMRADDDEARQMPLSLDEGAMGFDGEGAGGGKRSNRSGLLILVLILAIGGGTLWTMRITGTIGASNPGLAEAEAKIDAALKRFLAPGADGETAANPLDELFGEDTDQALAKLDENPTENQVAVEDVQMNPFELFVKPTTTVQVNDSPDAAARAAAELRRSLQTEFDRLELSSVLMGATPVAVVSNQVVKEGQTIGSFDVVSITQKKVELEAGGHRFTLEMADADQARSRAPLPGRRRR